MVKDGKVEIKAKVSELKPGIACIGSICFGSDDSITVKIPKDVDPDCARHVASHILAGKKVKFEIETKSIQESV